MCKEIRSGPQVDIPMPPSSDRRLYCPPPQHLLPHKQIKKKK